MRSAAHADRAGGILIVLAIALALIAGTITPAKAQPLPGVEELPRILIVARNDVPADALSAGPVAGALGGVILITPTGSLSAPAHDALVTYAPDRVYIAGGTAAISDATAQAIDAAGPWDVVRKSGPSRDHTAAALATILTDHGVTRPAVAGTAQIIGDVHVGGMLHARSLAVESDDHVANLSADLLDGLDSTDFLPADARGVATFGARIGANGSLRGWFNHTGGEPVIVHTLFSGQYLITVPGLTLDPDNFVAHVSTDSSLNVAGVTFGGAGQVIVTTRNLLSGAVEDATFNVSVLAASADG